MSDVVISKPVLQGRRVSTQPKGPKASDPAPVTPVAPPATGEGPAPATPNGRDPNAPFGDVFSSLFTPSDPIVVPTPYPNAGGTGSLLVPILAVAGLGALAWWGYRKWKGAQA